jgi:hypothetical protein
MKTPSCFDRQAHRRDGAVGTARGPLARRRRTIGDNGADRKRLFCSIIARKCPESEAFLINFVDPDRYHSMKATGKLPSPKGVAFSIIKLLAAG